MLVNVRNGTGAGRKRAMRAKPRWPWFCECPDDRPIRTATNPRVMHAPHIARCPRCRTRRP